MLMNRTCICRALICPEGFSFHGPSTSSTQNAFLLSNIVYFSHISINPGVSPFNSPSNNLTQEKKPRRIPVSPLAQTPLNSRCSSLVDGEGPLLCPSTSLPVSRADRGSQRTDATPQQLLIKFYYYSIQQIIFKKVKKRIKYVLRLQYYV